MLSVIEKNITSALECSTHMRISMLSFWCLAALLSTVGAIHESEKLLPNVVDEMTTARVAAKLEP